jgi:hypothetical protein
MNTKFTKIVDGVSVIKKRCDILINRVVVIEDPITETSEEIPSITYNPCDEDLEQDGWELYVKPEPTEEELKRKAISTKLIEIKNYDSSSEVNVFYIQGIPVWLDKATRSGLKLRFEAELAMKEETTTLWYNNQSFTLPLNDAIAMLYALEVYASKCYDNTQAHLANVSMLETIEEISNYDHTTGYPEKLNF